ncbi:hypothetical protein MMC09_000274, partial [Bachmanniomyces sp. S44760]|nr:hypothetical protein [Bachmanniomyces sp. S44760]
MEDSGQFEEVFGSDPNLAYSHQTIEKLVHNRKVLEGTLFFDRLLQTLNFKD